MNKIIKLTCLKDRDKKYMSAQNDNYINKLDVYYNTQKIFANINDAEENLPIILEKSIVYDAKHTQMFEFNYFIRFHSVEEYAKIKWTIKPVNYLHESHIQLLQLNHVKGSENLSDDYCITVRCNQHIYKLGKEYHQGVNKAINFRDLINVNGYCCFSVETKKVFKNSPITTYDHLQLEIL
jgi:hypothetical protein